MTNAINIRSAKYAKLEGDGSINKRLDCTLPHTVQSLQQQMTQLAKQMEFKTSHTRKLLAYEVLTLKRESLWKVTLIITGWYITYRKTIQC